MNNLTLAPIVLFVYNRPDHTLRTLRALQANRLADQSLLVIYADGPKPDATTSDLAKIEQTHNISTQKRWCKETQVITSDVNKGLADSIVEGVTQVVNEYGRVIVLEDDIVTSPGFLQYMNDALRCYENEEKVMHISGYMFPVKGKLPSTFFYNTASCWGWGTWKRAWQYFNYDAKLLAKEIEEKKKVVEFSIEQSYPFYQSLVDNAQGRLKTWAVRWYASFFLQGGYALHPYPSLVNNIGNDGSGSNSGANDIYSWEQLANHIEVNPIPTIESKHARRAMHKFYRNNGRKSKLSRVKLLASSLLSREAKIKLKKTISPSYRKEYDEYQRLIHLPRYTETTTTLLGKEIKVPDAASFLFMKKEIFDQEIYRFNSATETPYVVDCGANIGLSIIYFKTLFPEANIIGFEPDSKIFDILTHNLQVAGWRDVVLHKYAVWSNKTTLRFSAEGADGGRIEAEDTSAKERVEAIRLKEYINQPIDFLKIDIEGAETEIIEDCKDQLHFVRNMFIEYHSFVNRPQTLDRILSIIKESGFRFYIHTPGLHSKQPFIHVQESLGMDMQLNIYCIR